MIDYVLTFLAFFFGIGSVLIASVALAADADIRYLTLREYWEDASGTQRRQSNLHRLAFVWLVISYAITTGLLV